uniref:Fibronectin type-II domain-containing protein n=1 Tax=Scleropages formosus TaxID=113540 RepID=A0A8C9T9R9_SCLFO
MAFLYCFVHFNFILHEKYCAVLYFYVFHISTEYDISPNYCVFPFKYNGQLYFSCTSVDSKHERLWCSLTSDYDQDRLWESSCVFPFTVGGKTYNRCTTDYWLPGIPWCSTTANYDQDKKWSYCPSSAILSFSDYFMAFLYCFVHFNFILHEKYCAVLYFYVFHISTEYDISPNYCVFPFKYNGQLYFSCTSVDSKHERLWCSLTSDYDQDRLWESSCVFPFTVGGKTYNRCTTDYWFPGISWCSTTANYDQDKKWVYCPSSGIVLLKSTTGKKPCLFSHEHTSTHTHYFFSDIVMTAVITVCQI